MASNSNNNHHHQSVIIGITGQICSGKTSLLKIFSSLGSEYIIFSADEFVSYLYKNEQSVKDSIIKKFGLSVASNILNKDIDMIEIDKKKIISLIKKNNNFNLFDDLWNIVEPHVYNKILTLIDLKKKYLVIEIPTIYKSQIMNLCSTIIEVESNIENIKLRLKNRNIPCNISIDTKDEENIENEKYMNTLINLYKSEILHKNIIKKSQRIIKFINNINYRDYNEFYKKAFIFIQSIITI